MNYTPRQVKKQGFLTYGTFTCYIRGIRKIFGDCDEISLENPGFALAFCALFLYNDVNMNVGGVCTWAN